MVARSLPKTLDDPPPDDGRTSNATSQTAAIRRDLASQSTRLDGFALRIGGLKRTIRDGRRERGDGPGGPRAA